MIWLRYCIALVFFILFTSAAQAGKDPIGWSLTGSLPGQTTVNLQYKFTYTLVNNLPFTMPTPLIIAKYISGEFTVVDGCSGLRLTPGQTCTVGITFFPTSGGSKSFQIDEEYGANIVPLPKLITTTSVSTTPLVTGSITTLPSPIGTGQHWPITIQFTNNGNGTVIGPFTYTRNYPADGSFNYGYTGSTNTCTSTTTLPPGGSCMVTGTLSAKQAIMYTVGATLSYTGGSTTVSTTTTAMQSVTVSASPALPSQIAAGTSTLIGFTFTNTTSLPVYGTPFGNNPPAGEMIRAAILASPGTYTCTGGTNTCIRTGTPLNAGTSCSVTCNFIAIATGNYTVTGSFAYDGPTVTDQETTNAGRVFTIQNFCTFDVWYSFNGAAVGHACTVQSDCPAGTTCSTSAGQCYWTNPSPTSGGFHLAAAVGSTPSMSTVIIPDLNGSISTIWQGNFAGRTLCSGTSCVTANCNTTGGNNACDPGTPFPQTPSTKAAMTLMRGNPDYYSVQLVNGPVVATSMGPTTASGPAGQPYTCGTPGAATAINGEPACTWMFSPAASSSSPYMYVWVGTVATPTSCTSNAQCSASQVCGLSYNPSASPTFPTTLTCGPQLGYWSADAACQLDSGAADMYFHCNTPLTGSLSAYMLKNLYSCSPATSGGNLDSCYTGTIGTNPNCCGCQNWELPPTVLPTPPTPTFTTACVNFNPQWSNGTLMGEVLGTIYWIKQGCPSAAVYPDDTASSSFTCPAGAGSNITAYTISFCPLP